MKIALVWPKSTFISRSDVWPPLGLFYLAAQLESQGHECDFYDLNFDSLPSGDFYDQLWLSATSPQIAQVRHLAQETFGWKAKRVIGGPIAWCNPESVCSLGFDLVVSGEGDHPDTIRAILELAENPGVPHISVPIHPNLDWALPPVRRWSGRYHSFMSDRQGNPRRMATLFTTRGCPMECAFCESGRRGVIWGSRVRYEPLELVEEQIKQITALGFSGIAYYDDILPLAKPRTLTLMELHRRYGVVWRCFLRTDIICKLGGREYLKELADGGLVEIFMGVESADNAIKQAVGKGTTIEEDTAVLEWCRALQIRVKTSFILGLPSESRESMETTRRWILSKRPDRVQIDRLIPFPGTPLFDHPGQYDLTYEQMPEEEWFFKGAHDENSHSFVSTSHVSRDEIDSFWHSLNSELQGGGLYA